MSEESNREFLTRMGLYLTDGLDTEDCDRLLALALRGAETQWRPIEEAPKDGTAVLTTGPHDAGGSYTEVCVFYRGKWTITWMNGHGDPTHFIPLTALGSPNDE